MLGWLHGPLAAGRKRPFGRCLAELRRFPRGDWDDHACRQALRRVHAALDATAGGTLLAADMDGFLARHRRFRRVEEDLREFFRHSEAVFYREGPCDLGRGRLLALCRRCRDAERGLSP